MEVEQHEIDAVVARLKRVQGQVGGIVRMIEDGRECRDVVRQISAASKALENAGLKLLVTNLRSCLSDEAIALRKGYSEEEMEKLFMELA